MVTKKQEEDVVYDPEESEGDDLGGALEKIKKLKNELAQCRKERQEYLDGWQRMRADVANKQKREEGARKQAQETIKIRLVEQVLPVVDSFEMAFLGDTWQKFDEKWRAGVEQIYGQLQGALSTWGVESFAIAGDKFDPNIHEATSEESVEEKRKDGTLASVLQKGYKIGDTIIRPARVVVARAER